MGSRHLRHGLSRQEVSGCMGPVYRASASPYRRPGLAGGPARPSRRRLAQGAAWRLAARFSALITARSDALTIDSLIPTPQYTRSPTSISR